MREKIAEFISKSLDMDDIALELPEIEAHGDWTSNIALVSKERGSESPRQFAEKLVKKILNSKGSGNLFEKVEVAGPGFINFFLKKEVLLDTLVDINSQSDRYGGTDLGKGKTVIVDYSSPNIAKPFGIGHLRSTIIGQALYNLYKMLGYEVIGDNHLGDWGTQFGKLLYMIDKENVSDFSIENLEKLYVEFHSLAENDPGMEEAARHWFKKLEDGDSQAREIWKKCVDASMKEFERIYDLLGVKIDFAFGESYYESEMKQMMEDESIKEKLSKGEDGALVVDLTEKGIKTPLMFLKKDGATTYATRDLATIKFRVRKWDPDIIIYEVGAEQTLHFKQLFAASRLMGLVEKRVELVHTKHGLYLAPDGKKFSTRKGKTVKLEEVLDEAVKKAGEMGSPDEETSKKVGIGAIKYFDLMHSVESDVVFDWDKVVNLKGNSGPYIQYAFARTQSVLEKAGGVEKDFSKDQKIAEEEMSLLRSLARYIDIISMSAKNYSPNILCAYLYGLAGKYNLFYNKVKILGSKEESFRLALTRGVGQVIKNGLGILGIEAPEKM